MVEAESLVWSCISGSGVLDFFPHDNDPKHNVNALKAYLVRKKQRMTISHGEQNHDNNPEHSPR